MNPTDEQLIKLVHELSEGKDFRSEVSILSYETKQKLYELGRKYDVHPADILLQWAIHFGTLIAEIARDGQAASLADDVTPLVRRVAEVQDEHGDRIRALAAKITN